VIGLDSARHSACGFLAHSPTERVPTVNIDPVAPYITHITNLSGAHIFAQCAVCGDDLAIHEWVDIDNRTGYEIDCDRK